MFKINKNNNKKTNYSEKKTVGNLQACRGCRRTVSPEQEKLEGYEKGDLIIPISISIYLIVNFVSKVCRVIIVINL